MTEDMKSRINNPNGTPNIPKIIGNIISLNRTWLLFWTSMKTNTASETVLITTTVVFGSNMINIKGDAAKAMPNPAELNTNDPNNKDNTVIMISGNISIM